MVMLEAEKALPPLPPLPWFAAAYFWAAAA